MPLTKRTFIGAGLSTLTALTFDGEGASATSGTASKTLVVGVTQVGSVSALLKMAL